jgi:hypothetical protein
MSMKAKKNTKKKNAANPAETVEGALVPKPNRTEIIEALARREYGRRMKERNDAALALREEAERIKKELVKFIAKDFDRLSPSVRLNYGGTTASVDFHLVAEKVLPPPLAQRMKDSWEAVDALPRQPDMKAIRQEIRAAMSPAKTKLDKEERVGRLLADEKVTAAFDEMLEAIRKPAQAALSA